MTHEFLLYVMFNVNARNTKLDQNGMLSTVQELNTFDVLDDRKVRGYAQVDGIRGVRQAKL